MAAKLPEKWASEVVAAKRERDGSLRIDASYNAFDVPWDESIPHPFRAWMRIKQAAQTKSLVTCECCGRTGGFIGAGQEARVRCVQHGYVVDAVEWSGNPVGAMFDNSGEAMAHFLQDYGDGVDMMQELTGAAEQDSDDREETRH
ncbi:hypothetical protein [Rhizobium mongolense]